MTPHRTLVLAVCGTSIGYNGRAIKEMSARDLGHWTGGFVDRWTWHDDALDRLSDAELTALLERFG